MVLAGDVREGDGVLGVVFQGEQGGRELGYSLSWRELCLEGF